MYLQGIQITTSKKIQTFSNLSVYHQNIRGLVHKISVHDQNSMLYA